MNTAKRILVIDDDRVIRQSIAAYLEDSGYEVLLADDGLTGLELFRAEQPDLVVCDLRMPGLDGISVLHHISADHSETPIVVISGAGVMADVVEALRIGATDYLIKPILDLEVLEHSIERSLERAKLRRENASYRRKLERTNRELQAHLNVLETDQQAGRHVQMKMLPTAPQQIGEYRFDHRIIPSLYLSGDFVEYVTVGDDHIVFMIADVSGHGASSAFFTVLLKNLAARMRSNYGRRQDDTILHPAQFLARVNAEVLETELGKHITMFVACLNRQTHELIYSNAGHLPSPVMTAAGEAPVFLPGSGLPVGITEDASYQEETTLWPKGGKLSLFTDGILELFDGELADKEARLISECADQNESLDGLVTRLGLESVKDAPDDIAVFTVSHSE